MTATLAQLRLQARQRADMENSKFVSDSELNQYISDSYAELYDLLVTKFQDYYVADPVAFTLGTETSTSLPADFYKLLGVDRLEGSEWVELSPFTFAERNGSVPGATVTGSYRLWYTPKATALTTDSQTVDGVNGWEVYIVTDAAIKCLQKEESDVSVLMAQKMALKQRIEEAAASRDIGSSERVTDVAFRGEIFQATTYRYRLLGSKLHISAFQA